MSYPSPTGIPMSNPNLELLSKLTQHDLQRLINLCTSTTPSTIPPTTALLDRPKPSRGDLRLPKWNGDMKEIKFYLARLRTRIERGLEGVVEENSTCLDMIDTLPQELQARTEEWFQDRQNSRNYSWRELFDHFSELFGDQHVLETAVEDFCRIQQDVSNISMTI